MIEQTSPSGVVEGLTAASRALTYAVSLDEVLDITVEHAAQLLEAEKSVLLVPDAAGELRIGAFRGLGPEAIEGFDDPLDERLAQRLSRLFEVDDDRRPVAVPVVVDGGVVGLLAVLRAAGRPVTESEEALLSALADQSAVALERQRSRDASARFERRIRELEKATLSQEQALQVLGHDLRSPLSAMQGYLQMLASGLYGPVNDGQTQTLERLQTIAAHLRGLLGNVREMASIAAGGVDVELRRVAVRSVVEQALAIVALAAQDAEIRIRTDEVDDLTTLAEPDRLRQVLVHLLDNAVKYGPPGSEVRVVAAADADGRRVAIRVSDQGPGISADEADEVFLPYHRVDRTASGKHGIGLGLSLARSITELMGGTLDIDPAASKGATFVLRLPVA